MKWNQVIAIGRQFGSGGREIGQRVAQELGIPCYDRELIELASQKLGVDEYDLEQVDETALNHFLSTYQVAERRNPETGIGVTLNDSLYMAQCGIIDTLAAKGPCVIVGRTAAEVLQNNPRCINVFIGADRADRVKRIMELYQLSEREALSAIRRVDRRRKFYYENYTDKVWGSLESHQLMLNVSLLGKDRTVEIIKSIYLAESARNGEEE